MATDHRLVHEHGHDVVPQPPTTPRSTTRGSTNSTETVPPPSASQSVTDASAMKSKFELALQQTVQGVTNAGSDKTTSKVKVDDKAAVLSSSRLEAKTSRSETDTSAMKSKFDLVCASQMNDDADKLTNFGTPKYAPRQSVSGYYDDASNRDNRPNTDDVTKSIYSPRNVSEKQGTVQTTQTLTTNQQKGFKDSSLLVFAGLRDTSSQSRGSVPAAVMVAWDTSRFDAGGVDISKLHHAAVTIQALWRGYRLRRRLQYALGYARLDGDAEHDWDMPDVDLNQFNFDEMDFYQDWTLPTTPHIPQNHPVLGNPGSFTGVNPVRPDSIPPPRCAAWQNNGDSAHNVGGSSPHPQYNAPGPAFPTGKPPLPPLSSLSNHTTDNPTQRTAALSKKEEAIAEEWGFKNSRTAELLLQRARRMQNNVVKRKKLSQLDPKQRLALLRKLEESSPQLRTVQVAPKRQPLRVDYFQAMEAERNRAIREEHEEKANKAGYTYEWIHTQVVRHQDAATPHINGGLKRGGSEGSLPRMDVHALARHRPSLLHSPLSMELQSVDGSSIASNSPKQRRLSFNSDRLPPLQSVLPPGTTRPTEKMSWRTVSDVDKSGGWGSGKRRNLRHK